MSSRLSPSSDMVAESFSSLTLITAISHLVILPDARDIEEAGPIRPRVPEDRVHRSPSIRNSSSRDVTRKIT